MKDKLEVRVTACGTEQWVDFTGKLVHGEESAGKARRMLLGLAHKDNSRIILDLGNVTHIDASGVESIVLAAAAAWATPATNVEIWRMPDFTHCSLALVLQVRLYTACGPPKVGNVEFPLGITPHEVSRGAALDTAAA